VQIESAIGRLLNGGPGRSALAARYVAAGRADGGNALLEPLFPVVKGFRVLGVSLSSLTMEEAEREPGSALGAALGMLQPGGTCVTFGVSEAAHTTFASRDFFATGGVRLYGLTLFHELMSVERAGIGLALLAELIAAKSLRPQIAVEAPWSEIGTVARRLIDREFTGKAVLHVL
jgi:hypothetical protein